MIMVLFLDKFFFYASKGLLGNVVLSVFVRVAKIRCIKPFSSSV